MREKPKLSSAQWVSLLAQEELPAITSIAGILEKFANDDRSSIPKLSEVILHDQALSACLLRVANSSSRSPVNKVTTVSRAAIFLGVKSVKNICLTARVLEGLLHSKRLAPEVYERLMRLMANAFFAGLLARMMVPDYDENTQEEVYLAAMMQNIGETAFWSTGKPVTRELIKKVGMPKIAFEQHCASQSGIKFKEMSIGLARTWKLGELLIKSLDQPHSRTREIKIISLSNQLSEAIGAPPKNRAKFDQLLQEIADMMDIDTQLLKQRVESTRQMALELLGSYEASILESYIRKLPSEDELGNEHSPVKTQLNTEQKVIATAASLTKLTQTSRSIYDFTTTILQNLASTYHFHRVSFWAFNSEKTTLECRQSVDSEGQPIRYINEFFINDMANVMTMALSSSSAIVIEDHKHPKWRDCMTIDSELFIEDGLVCLSPIALNGRNIGVLSAQFFDRSVPFESKDIECFSFLAGHLNLCLSAVARAPRKKV